MRVRLALLVTVAALGCAGQRGSDPEPRFTISGVLSASSPREGRATRVEALRFGVVHFRAADSALTPEALAALEKRMATIAELQASGAWIRITGYSDDFTESDANVALGQARALAVYRYLLDRGVQNRNIRILGTGDEPNPRDQVSRNRVAVLTAGYHTPAVSAAASR